MQVKRRAEDHQPLDCNVVTDIAVGFIDADPEHRHILAKNGGAFKAEQSWASDLLAELSLKRRRCTTAASHLPDDWQQRIHKTTLQV